MKYILFLLVLTAAAPIRAEQTNCQSQRQFSIAYSRCLDQKLENLQRELLTWENNHLLQLEDIAAKSGRKEPLVNFRKSRKSFKTYSTEHCRWQYLALVPDSQAGATLYKECMLDLLQGQIELLSKIKY